MSFKNVIFVEKTIMEEKAGLTRGKLLKLIEDLHNDGNYKFELLVASILFCGLKVSEVQKLTKVKLFEICIGELYDGKRFREIVFNSPLFQELKGADGKVEEPDKELFKFTTQHINKELNVIKWRYLDKTVESLSTNEIRRVFAKTFYVAWSARKGYTQEMVMNKLKETLHHKNLSTTYDYIGLSKNAGNFPTSEEITSEE